MASHGASDIAFTAATALHGVNERASVGSSDGTIQSERAFTAATALHRASGRRVHRRRPDDGSAPSERRFYNEPRLQGRPRPPDACNVV